MGLLATGGLLVVYGCSDPGNVAAPAAGGRSADEGNEPWRADLFQYAIDSLNRLEQFDSGEMLSTITRRINPPPDQGPEPDTDPLLMTWPVPEMLGQIVGRLNQWVITQRPLAGWQPDPLLATLPEELRNVGPAGDLNGMAFSAYDGLALREAVWLRDVSRWARGERLDDLSRAGRLFDWTIRNIELVPDRPAQPGGEVAISETVPLVPWETLLFGRGTALERAWVFILLARQQGIDAAILAVPEPADAAGSAASASGDVLRPWAVGVLSEGAIYLFDPWLGLPIPAPDGIGHDEEGRLVVRPATLAQAVEDPSVLGRLDADAEHPYPFKAADLDDVVALVEASPAYLSRRMKLVESRLTGDQKTVLTIAAEAQAERFRATPHVSSAGLWRLPYETLHRRLELDETAVRSRLVEMLRFCSEPALWKGRMLYLAGRLTGEEGAAGYLQAARPSNEQLVEGQGKLVEEILEQIVKQREAALGPMSEAEKKQLQERARPTAVQQVQLQIEFALWAKQDATYWLGLISYERQNYAAAHDYLATRTLEATPDGPWTDGAVYNLARAFEAAGQAERAASLLTSHTGATGYHGNLLRARWLSQGQPGPPSAETGQSPGAEPATPPTLEVPAPPEAPPVPEPEPPQAPEAPPADAPAPQPSPEPEAAPSQPAAPAPEVDAPA